MNWIVFASDLSPIQTTALLTGVVTGISGLLLGLFNAYTARRRDTARLRVTPKIRHILSIDGNSGETEKSVGIVAIENIGAITVTVAQVHLTLRGKKGDALLLPKGRTVETGGYLPYELTPGKAVNVRFNAESLLTAHKQMGGTLDRVVATSIISERFCCSRRAMTGFEKDLQQLK